MIEVVAAIIKENDKYLIARRASHKEQAGKWEFPGGKIEIGETPEIALKRELQEELNVGSVIGRFIESSVCDIGNMIIRLMAYEVNLLSHEFNLSDHDDIVWVSLDDIDHYEMSAADVAIWKGIKASF